jgi:hypothetical protein
MHTHVALRRRQWYQQALLPLLLPAELSKMYCRVFKAQAVQVRSIPAPADICKAARTAAAAAWTKRSLSAQLPRLRWITGKGRGLVPLQLSAMLLLLQLVSLVVLGA